MHTLSGDEKHEQLNRTRLTSCGVLREEIKMWKSRKCTKHETEIHQIQQETQNKDKNKDSVDADTARARTKKVVKGKHKPKNADAHNLDSKSVVAPEVEIVNAT